MTHHIKHPENWPLLEDLHNHLWKTFPMDRFDFIASSGEFLPVYSGTTLPTEQVFTVMRGDPPKVAFFDDVTNVLKEFLCGITAESPAESSNESAAKLKVA